MERVLSEATYVYRCPLALRNVNLSKTCIVILNQNKEIRHENSSNKQQKHSRKNRHCSNIIVTGTAAAATKKTTPSKNTISVQTCFHHHSSSKSRRTTTVELQKNNPHRSKTKPPSFPVLLGDHSATETVFFHSEENRRDFVRTRRIDVKLRRSLGRHIRDIYRDLVRKSNK